MKHKTELSQIKEKDDSKRVSEKEVISYGVLEGFKKYLKHRTMNPFWYDQYQVMGSWS